jgi:hypothetical protein
MWNDLEYRSTIMRLIRHVSVAICGVTLAPQAGHSADIREGNMDSFLQACNLIPLQPDPLREACFRRVLGNMEAMARERPGSHINGDRFLEFDFCSTWGLVENYLMRRLFGSPETAIPEAEIEARLTGVQVNEAAKFVLHRTTHALSSFSWHTIVPEKRRAGHEVMGLTMPLDKDVMVFPAVGGYVGDLREASKAVVPLMQVEGQRVDAGDNWVAVLANLDHCGGKVRQSVAFISLPDGRSVYFDWRVALQQVDVAVSTAGTVQIYDDTAWPNQKAADTAQLAAELERQTREPAAAGVFALLIAPYRVYVNFTEPDAGPDPTDSGQKGGHVRGVGRVWREAAQ